MSDMSKNPHFNHINRAPYELGTLLHQIPLPFIYNDAYRATEDELLIAEAAAQHARNGNVTVMRGTEAIGAMLTAAAAFEDWEVDANQLQHLGELVRHLAVEGQFLQFTDTNLRQVVNKRKGRTGKPK